MATYKADRFELNDDVVMFSDHDVPQSSRGQTEWGIPTDCLLGVSDVLGLDQNPYSELSIGRGAIIPEGTILHLGEAGGKTEGTAGFRLIGLGEVTIKASDVHEALMLVNNASRR